MSRCLVLIRCTKATSRITELATQLIDQGFEVLAVPDLINVAHDHHAHVTSGFPIRSEALTEEFLRDYGLPFWNDRKRTGWACGDYVFYRALKFEWDYAWIVEPDVYFLNGAPSILAGMAELETDLITTNYWRSSDNWYWRKPLADVFPELDVHAMAFPLVRVSRRLAESSLKLRQHVTRVSKSGDRVPNDESVLATAAHSNGYSFLDLKKEYPHAFRYWSTVLKYPIDDVRQREKNPLILHSGLEEEEFLSYVLSLWGSVENGSSRERERLLKVLSTASVDTLRRIFAELTLSKI